MERLYVFVLPACWLTLLLLGSAWRVAAQPALPIEWENTFGGSEFDAFHGSIALSDGGFLLCGESYSGVSGNKTAPAYGQVDAWVVRLDANGQLVWDKTFGGSGIDTAMCATATPDGGFLVGGFSDSGISANKSSRNYGNNDYWLIKLDATGKRVWDKTYGGGGNDAMTTIYPTVDGGYLLLGGSTSGISGNKTSRNYGDFDLWLVKVDAEGNKLWDSSYGGSGRDWTDTLKPVAIAPAADGGFLLGGPSRSAISGNKTSINYGQWDYWIVKVDANGNKMWDASYGGPGDDILNVIAPMAEGGFFLIGWSQSEASLVRVDAEGKKLWESNGSGGASVALTDDGGFLLGGLRVRDPNSFNLDFDFWLIKLDKDGAYQWTQDFLGSHYTVFGNVVRAADGGFLLGLEGDHDQSPEIKSSPNYGKGDFWVIKLAGPPRLAIQSTTVGMRLSWPLHAVDYVLEMKDTLSDPGAGNDWSQVSGPYETEATEISVTLKNPSGNRFYRLLKP